MARPIESEGDEGGMWREKRMKGCDFASRPGARKVKLKHEDSSLVFGRKRIGWPWYISDGHYGNV